MSGTIKATTIANALKVLELEREYYLIKKEKAKVKAERIAWYESNPVCSCVRELDSFGKYVSGDKYDGTCSFCTRRNDYYKQLQELSNKQRAIRNTIARIVN